jgi:2-keto-4-pentenoate hydratase/2-oxohepta-3-ene-1,7-dioic acid hydratase in catechol pathway
MVTRDEVCDPHLLAVELKVNGVVMQSSSTARMVDVPTLMEFISPLSTLEPGDLIATGTPSGVGHVRDLRRTYGPAIRCR